MANLLARNSDTPTVNNSDFTRMTRNSCLGYDGVTKGYGLECALSSAASSIKIGSGEMVVQGWQVLITANGEILAIDNLPDKRYYSLYLEIDLSRSSYQTAIFKVIFSLSAYPVIDKGNDLTTNPSGIARLLVAHFTAQNGIISSLVSKVSIFGSGDAPTQVQSDSSKKIANTEYVRSITDSLSSSVTNIQAQIAGKAGYYKGSSAGNSDYPIGSIILARAPDFGGSSPVLNSIFYVRQTSDGNSDFTAVEITNASGKYLLGEWRYRGRAGGISGVSPSGVVLLQRVE